MTINGVDVVPLIEAELDRRYPDRSKMRPNDAAGFREAWDIVERLWDGTVARARRLPSELLHERIDGEWSFIQTLRHVVFATDAWVGRVMLGDPAPWDALDLPFDEMRDQTGVSRDRGARPSLDEVLTLRRDLAGAGELPGAQCASVHPQRGMPASPVRRARPRRVGVAQLSDCVRTGVRRRFVIP